MTALKNNDFSSLSASSLSNLGVGRYRSLQELRVASESLGGGAALPFATTTTTTHHHPDLQALASRLRASHTLQSQAPSTTATTTTGSSEPPPFRTPSQRVEDSVQRIFHSLLEREREETTVRLEELYDERRSASHEAFVNQILSEVKGHRTLGGSASLAAAGQPSSNTPRNHLPSSRTATTDIPATTAAPTLENKQLAEAYLEIVQQWTRHWNTVSLEQVLPAFCKAAALHASSSPSIPHAWKLCECLLASSNNNNGGLAFYSHQFRDIVQQRVRSAQAAGQDTSTSLRYTNPTAQMAASYVKLTQITSQPLWPTVYTCLRMGDAVAAHHVLSSSSSESSATPAIGNVLAQWSQVQGTARSLWEAPGGGSLGALDPELTRLYQRAVQQTNGAAADPHYVATLGLLSRHEPLLESSTVQTTEDYMFGWLWYAASSAQRRTEMVDTLTELGPSQFPDGHYSLVLLSAQEYEAALGYLQQQQDLLQATHLGLVLSKAQVLRDDETVTSLLVQYARRVSATSPTAAVEYLVRIPNEDRRLTEIARLGVETGQLEGLPLGELCSASAVSLIMAEAAQQASTKGDDDLAAKLLFQSGHYDLVLRLLNRTLSSEMLRQSRSDRKWRDQSKAFHHDCLSDTQNSPVLRDLQSKGGNTQEQLSTFRLLLAMNEAMELVEADLFGEALDKMDQLPLLPRTESECAQKVRQYRALDATVQSVFPLLLEMALQCTSALFGRLKTPGYDRNSSLSEQQRLQAKARLWLFTLGGMLHADIPRDVMDRMTRLERTMV